MQLVSMVNMVEYTDAILKKRDYDHNNRYNAVVYLYTMYNILIIANWS